MTEEEGEILAKYSTPGLKRCILSRYAKTWHLRENYRMSRQEREELLDHLYGTQIDKRYPEEYPNDKVDS